jgi:molybdopterin-synthase adenylyltransferase
LKELAEHLKASGEVTVNQYLLRLHARPYEITVFADGRGIIKGTEDPALARSLYSRYVGI